MTIQSGLRTADPSSSHQQNGAGATSTNGSLHEQPSNSQPEQMQPAQHVVSVPANILLQLSETYQCSILTLILSAWSLLLLRQSDSGEAQLEWSSEGDVQSAAWRIQAVTATAHTTIRDIVNNVQATPGVQDGHASQSNLQISIRTKSSLSVVQLNISYDGQTLCITPASWLIRDILWLYRLYADSLVEILTTDHNTPSTTLDSATNPLDCEKARLWSWNRTVPNKIDQCMHDLISKTAFRQPDAIAIESWDGSFTYSQVETLSNKLAGHLLHLGITPNTDQIIPICFEKSRWTTVAVLAVMKAGAAIVLMDPSQPVARLQGIAKDVNASIIISSELQAQFASSILERGTHLVIDSHFFEQEPLAEQSDAPLPVVKPSSILYIIFTSGSTGKPKGVVISHECYTTGTVPRANEVGYDEKSRVLDFASYAFDVSIDSMLCTLLNGGCLCILSEDDRVNDLNGGIRRFRVNMANLTPSVARILERNVISSLRSLGLGGEAATAHEVNEWGKLTRIMIAYGPSECTVGCTIHRDAALGRDYISLGKGIGGNMWIVDPADHSRLTPLGGIGELLVEGHIVGSGYLNDPEKTRAVFIENVPWLLAGHKSTLGRRGRLYKTGDLCRYDPDGTGHVVFVGRKDTQVKLRGQRVELEEIEHNLRQVCGQNFKVVAEVLTPQGRKDRAILAAFLHRINKDQSNGEAKQKTETSVMPLDSTSPELLAVIDQLRQKLPERIPGYMVPYTYLPVTSIPMTVSGKTDRKQLREVGSAHVFSQVSTASNDSAASSDVPLNSQEDKLRNIWAKVLAIDPNQIKKDTLFTTIGGDSVSAMKLVMAAKDSSLPLTVLNVLQNPRLSDMASSSPSSNDPIENVVMPMSLLPDDGSITGIGDFAAQSCGVPLGQIKDIYPCTPLQETLMALSIRSPEAFVAQRTYLLPENTDIHRFRSSWETAVLQSWILSTRIIQFSQKGLHQVVIEEPLSWYVGEDLQDYLKQDAAAPMTFGQPLARYALIQAPGGKHITFVWTVHHALYDAWSTPLLLNRVIAAYRGEATPPEIEMKHFVRYILESQNSSSESYWREELKGANGTQFPVVPSRSYIPTCDKLIERRIPLSNQPRRGYSIADVIRAAWALTSSQYTMSDDVVFAETLAGRDINLIGIESLEGPVVTTIPMRIKIHRSSTAGDFLSQVRQTCLERTPHQHYGLQNIRRLNEDAQVACELKTGINIQIGGTTSGSSVDSSNNIFNLSAEDPNLAANEAIRFNSYCLLLVFSEANGILQVAASFDGKLVSQPQMLRVLAQFENIFTQLVTEPHRKLINVDPLSKTDKDLIWSWNQIAPYSIDRRTGILDSSHREPALKIPKPGLSVPWILDLSGHQRLAPVGVVGELWYEGHFDHPDAVDNPAWLLVGNDGSSGRKGRIYPTGELAKYRSDGLIVFLGKRDNLISLNDTTVDTKQVQKSLESLLGSGAAVHIVVSQDTAAPRLLALVHDSSSQTDVNAMTRILREDATALEGYSNQRIRPEGSISRQLLHKMMESTKALSETLSASAKPYTFIPISSTISSTAARSQFLRNLTADIIEIYREYFAKAETSLQKGGAWSTEETQVQTIWSALLDVDAPTISQEDNFFRLGGDSIIAMRLVTKFREKGFKLSVADVFRNQKLSQMAKVLKPIQTSQASEQSRDALQSELSVDPTTKESISRQLVSRLGGSAVLSGVYEATDSQARDIENTINKPRNAVQYTLFFLPQSIVTQKLRSACDQLFLRNEILRTVFINNKQKWLQAVVRNIETPWETVNSTDKNFAATVNQVCNADVEKDFEQGQLFLKFMLVRGANHERCLIMRLSHAQYDGVSLSHHITELSALYNDPSSTLPSEQFSMFVKQLPKLQQASRSYWNKQLESSSLTLLAPESRHRDGQVEADTVEKGIPPISKEGFTVSSLVNAAWAVVLSKRTGKQDVTFGYVGSGRGLDVDLSHTVAGPCYNHVPLRVRLTPKMRAVTLLNQVQDFVRASMPHEATSFSEMAASEPGWASDAPFFDSTVNHQDIPYVDTVEIGDAQCRLDIRNPHKQAGLPWKVFSYFRNEQFFIGVMGPKDRRGFMAELVDQLHDTLTLLAGNQDTVIV